MITNKEKEQIKNIIEHSKRKYTDDENITFHNIFTKEQVEYIKKIDVEFWYCNKFIVRGVT